MDAEVLIVFGTRPEIIKLAPLTFALKRSRIAGRVVTATTSQHDELQDMQLAFWGIKPDHVLPPCPHKGNLVRMLAHTLAGLQDILDSRPSIRYILVQGDTNTALACAQVAFFNRIRLLHVEAGLRSFDLGHPFPEEFNRIVASKAAHFHFAPTTTARDNLVQEGVARGSILVTGNTVVDALQHALGDFQPLPMDARNLVVITLHRRENIAEVYQSLIGVVGRLANAHPSLQFLWVTHPNSATRIAGGLPRHERVQVVQHLPYGDFIQLYARARFVITDSGGVTEEAVQMGIPVVVFRKTTERAEPLAHAYPMHVSTDPVAIGGFFEHELRQPTAAQYAFGDGSASDRITRWLEEELSPEPVDIAVIGGGPAGTGLFLKALKDGQWDALFTQRIALLEAGSHLLAGQLADFQVNSDTLADVFLECLQGHAGASLDMDELADEVATVGAHCGGPIPLPALRPYLLRLGAQLEKKLSATPNCILKMNTPANGLQLMRDGCIRVAHAGGHLVARKVVLATGATPFPQDLPSATFAGRVPLAPHARKLIHADTLLRMGAGDLHAMLPDRPRVVVLGGGHSAFSVAHTLLAAQPAFGEGDIAVWAKARPKVFFPSREAAEAAGYGDFTEADICPVTQRLYRLAGLRMDGRALYLRMLGLGDGPEERRVRLEVFDTRSGELEAALQAADLVVVAFGYHYRMPPLRDADGHAIALAGALTRHWVDEDCALLDGDGRPVPNLYATGLASGFVPSGELGGEESFHGQTNGLWYYQNLIASRILQQLGHAHPATLP